MEPAVGDFVAAGAPLFRVLGTPAGSPTTRRPEPSPSGPNAP